MLRHCIAAGCNSIGGKGCSLTMFLKDEAITKKWIKCIKDQKYYWMVQKQWRNQPTSDARA